MLGARPHLGRNTLTLIPLRCSIKGTTDITEAFFELIRPDSTVDDGAADDVPEDEYLDTSHVPQDMWLLGSLKFKQLCGARGLAELMHELNKLV